MNRDSDDLPKFERLRHMIRGQILTGAFRDGEPLPSEEALSTRYRVARITVRRALRDLKEERIITGARRRGNVVTLRRGGHRGDLKMVVIVSHKFNPFFWVFLRHFEQAAGELDTVVVLKHDPQPSLMGTAQFYQRLLDNGVRDFVLWPGHGFDGLDLLPRLRGLGLNLVFLDHFIETAYADCVGLDNRHAVTTLYETLRARGCRSVHFMGWDDVPLSSTAERTQAFLEVASPPARVHRMSQYPQFEGKVRKIIDGLKKERDLPDAFLCINGDLASAVSLYLAEQGLREIHVATVDAIPRMPGVPITCVAQPLDRMGKKAFECLRDQNRLGERWTAARYPIKGTLQ